MGDPQTWANPKHAHFRAEGEQEDANLVRTSFADGNQRKSARPPKPPEQCSETFTGQMGRASRLRRLRCRSVLPESRRATASDPKWFSQNRMRGRVHGD